MVSDAELFILKKYWKGALLDDEDEQIVEILCMVGLMKTGTHCEMNDKTGMIMLKPTAKTLDLGKKTYKWFKGWW